MLAVIEHMLAAIGVVWVVSVIFAFLSLRIDARDRASNEHRAREGRVLRAWMTAQGYDE